MRTTTVKVRAVLGTEMLEDQLERFIEDASLWVTEELTSSQLSTNRLEVIERYLACAFVRIKEMGLKSVSIGDASESYQTNSEISDYLQRAAGLDPTGKIRKAFLTPLNLRIIPAITRVGQGFVDSSE